MAIPCRRREGGAPGILAFGPDSITCYAARRQRHPGRGPQLVPHFRTLRWTSIEHLHFSHDFNVTKLVGSGDL